VVACDMVGHDLAVGPFVGPNPAVLGPSPVARDATRYRLFARACGLDAATNAMLHRREVAGSKPAAPCSELRANQHVRQSVRALVSGLGSHKIRRWANRGSRGPPFGVRKSVTAAVAPSIGSKAVRRHRTPRALGRRRRARCSSRCASR
jgi:hypothetical protein